MKLKLISLHVVYFCLAITITACKTITTKTNKENTDVQFTKSPINGLIRDCPDERIRNAMPITDTKQTTRKEYYIYKGKRKELEEFDSLWVIKNCKVHTTVVY
jgi:hypothetical protein